jgi:serine/threonine protein kinase
MADPQHVAKYVVRGLMRRGGMGAVYLAYDPELERDVVIKLLREEDDPGLQQRFAREAKAIARLRHPNIVTIFDYGIDDGRQYIVMEYIPGETFAEVIRRRAVLTLDRKLELIEGVCAGLSHAHAAGIVHRDVKPANLMIDVDGTVKVLDFGIARTTAPTLTAEGDVIGTLNYMSPEQLTTGRVDARSDIFAVGAVLYELIAYQRAFQGDLTDGLAARIVNTEPPPLSEVCSEVTPSLSHTAAKALEKDPEERYQDLLALKNDLANLRRHLTSGAPPEPEPIAADEELALRSGNTTIPVARLRRWRPERRGWIAGTAAAALSVAAGAAWLSQATLDPPGAPEIAPPNATARVPTAPSPPVAAPAPPATSATPPIGPERSEPTPSTSRKSGDQPPARSSDPRQPPTPKAEPDTPRPTEPAAPSPDRTALDGRPQPVDTVPLPRGAGREEPQLSTAADPAAPASSETTARTKGPDSPAVHEQQIRATIDAYVKGLATDSQQVEVLARPVVSLAADLRSASASCTLRFRNRLRPGATFDRKMVLQLRRRDTAWEVETP